MKAVSSKDIALTRECVDSFSKLSGLGCLLCDPEGNTLYDVGYSCKRCALCACTGASRDVCVVSRAHAWADAGRFGGKYIYACPTGLTCIATPVQTDQEIIGYLTAGPFLMVEEEDFIQCELSGLDDPQAFVAREALMRVPRLKPDQAEPAAQQLFLAVGGMGSAFSISALLAQQSSNRLMGDLADFTNAAKQSQQPREYPLALERELLAAISRSDRAEAERLLNELLGHIFFLTGGDFSYIRARICELLVLSSRAAMEGGAEGPVILSLCQRCIAQMQDIYDTDKLCYWLTTVLRQFIDCLFTNTEERLCIPRALSYISRNYARKLSLEEVAREVYLSPAYFSRLFKRETGQAFRDYLLEVRVEHAKALLRQDGLLLGDVAMATGFGDQSHFTKAFKQATGVTPGAYRRKRRGYNELEAAEPRNRS